MKPEQREAFEAYAAAQPIFRRQRGDLTKQMIEQSRKQLAHAYELLRTCQVPETWHPAPSAKETVP
ncbi:hypothetical protein [Bradyrhizobium sp. 192]|uniref:hypothetical protein n=1 Tax=Bradyrhizobium sp. 192 TaxID=2782660 RepID=UPI001FFF9974|nr:hypothetical protein [Bradyrhizobium sp. 192]UPJ55963.1 hypothetical protein IVB24_25415 [Bradyrhizobium sp. 192]